MPTNRKEETPLLYTREQCASKPLRTRYKHLFRDDIAGGVYPSLLRRQPWHLFHAASLQVNRYTYISRYNHSRSPPETDYMDFDPRNRITVLFNRLNWSYTRVASWTFAQLHSNGITPFVSLVGVFSCKITDYTGIVGGKAPRSPAWPSRPN